MIDQANKLRDMINASKTTADQQDESQASELSQDPSRPLNLSARVITITSGKGGVGKTNFAVNLAVQFSKSGKRVAIIDADFGLANIDVLFGVVPRYTIGDVLQGEKTLDEVITPGPAGISFISGGSGMSELANMSEKQMHYLLDNFSFLDSIADIVLIDTGAGISNTVTDFIKVSPETIIISTPEPTSITDAYAIMKTVKEDIESPNFKIVVNRVDNNAEGIEIFEKLNMVSKRFLDIELTNLGSIPHDSQLIKAVKKQQPVSTCFPSASSTRSFELISSRLLNAYATQNAQKQDGVKSFMKRLANIFGK